MSPLAEPQMPIDERARRFAPVVWLLGKVQSGKTSIIRALTQASDAEIGSGFRACTKTARVFDFPAEAPIIRFLDTRGLGEVGLRPGGGHRLLRGPLAPDPGGGQGARRRAAGGGGRHRARQAAPSGLAGRGGANQPARGLSRAGQRHVAALSVRRSAVASDAVPARWPARSTYQRTLFRGAARPRRADLRADRFHASWRRLRAARLWARGADRGADRRRSAAVALALAELPRARRTTPRRASPTPISWASRSPQAPATPSPSPAPVAVPMVQAAMLRQLAKLHGASWDKRAYAEFAGALGTGTLVRVASAFGVRQLVKLIPVYGQTAGAAAAAAASFAATYAMGKAASYFLARRASRAAGRGGRIGLPAGAARRLPPGQGARSRRRRTGAKP